MEIQNYHRRPQDDIPYERRMLNIIQGYRKLLEENERLAQYARKLENKIKLLEEKKASQGLANKRIYDVSVARNREIKRLKAHIEWLMERLKEKEKE